jgi:hypothetical protein
MNRPAFEFAALFRRARPSRQWFKSGFEVGARNVIFAVSCSFGL